MIGELLGLPPHSTTHLHVLELSSNNAESVVARMMIDADFRDARRRSAWQPLLLHITVHHHRRLCTHHRMFTAHQKQQHVVCQFSQQDKKISAETKVGGMRAHPL